MKHPIKINSQFILAALVGAITMALIFVFIAPTIETRAKVSSCKTVIESDFVDDEGNFKDRFVHSADRDRHLKEHLPACVSFESYEIAKDFLAIEDMVRGQVTTSDLRDSNEDVYKSLQAIEDELWWIKRSLE